VLIRLWWRGRKNPAYRSRIPERFGFTPKAIPERAIWIHAVSVGESQATQPLVRWLLENYPDFPVIISTTTPTGADRVNSMYGDKVPHLYFPYDLPLAIGMALKNLKPRLLIIMETEIWPNLLHECSLKNIPVLLANARLSEPSANSYARFAGLTRNALLQMKHIAVQNTADAQRFARLGALDSQITVCGSIKFDVHIPASIRERGELLRATWGVERHAWVAASTHAGEDEQMIAVHKRILEKYPDALMILTPRHPERFDEVTQLLQNSGLVFCRRSENPVCNSQSMVYLGDTMGDLTVFFAAADVAFVGGSLVDVGGHNILEPASLGLPVIVGPYMKNFLSITDMMKEQGALLQVANSDELYKRLSKLFENSEKRAAIGNAGLVVVKKNQGSLNCLAECIKPCLQ
jgi:3-deoxy-D-manno-octulosonic-acid transferase